MARSQTGLTASGWHCDTCSAWEKAHHAAILGSRRNRDRGPGNARLVVWLPATQSQFAELMSLPPEQSLALTAFMVGLGAGSPLGHKLVARWPRRAIAISLACCGAASLATLATLLQLPRLRSYPVTVTVDGRRVGTGSTMLLAIAFVINLLMLRLQGGSIEE